MKIGWFFSSSNSMNLNSSSKSFANIIASFCFRIDIEATSQFIHLRLKVLEVNWLTFPPEIEPFFDLLITQLVFWN